MIVYGWAFLAFFVDFVALHSALLLLCAAKLRRYAARTSSSASRLMLRSPLAPPITVVVPAHNEEAGIADSVRSLLALDYPQLEVIVVNDGSTDGTLQLLIEVFGLHPVRRPIPPYLPHEPVRGVYAPHSQLRLLVLDKDNGGKADALNAGINFAGRRGGAAGHRVAGRVLHSPAALVRQAPGRQRHRRPRHPPR